MRSTVKKVGLAGIGLGVKVRNTVKRTGKELVKEGEKHKGLLQFPRRVLRKGIKKGAKLAGREAIAISQKSLEILEREIIRLQKDLKTLQKKTKKR